MRTLSFRPTSILSLLLVVSLPLLAQRPGKSGIGFKLGAQMSTNRSAAFAYEPIVGAVVGMYAPLCVANRLEVQPELLISMQGSSFAPGEGERSVMHLFYVQMPVSVKLYFSNTLNLQTGIQAGYMLTALNNGSSVTDLYKPLDLGFNVGLGFDMRTGTDLAVRYYSGMTPVLLNDATLFPTNRTVQFTVGRRFIRFKTRARRRH